MRHGEILRTRFEQLDLDKQRIFLPKAKGGRREQPITLELADIIAQGSDGSGRHKDKMGIFLPLVRRRAPSGHRDRMGKPFQRAVLRSGLDPKIVTPHVMRHTAITKLVQSGVDLPTIQSISGHKTLAMVLRYTHVHGTHIDKAITAIGRAVPEPRANKISGTVTQGLHTAANTVTIARTLRREEDITGVFL